MPSESRSRIDAEDRLLLEYVGRGWTDARIAREMTISTATLQRRLQRLSRDLGANSRVTLVIRAIQVGAIDCSETMRWTVEADPSPFEKGT